MGTASFVFNILNLSILFITALIILWYTVETFKLRKESVKQTDALWRPLLDFDGNSPWPPSNFPLKLLNVGRGIAKNIEGYLVADRKKYKMYFSKFGQGGMLEKYDGLGYLEFCREGIEAKINNQKYEISSEEDCIILNYQNINSRIYQTKITKDGSTVFLPSKE